MEKEIFTSEFEKVANTYDVKLWVAEKLGRRWSYVIGGGNEKFLPASLIGKVDNYGVFVEGENYNAQEILKDVGEILSKFRDIQKG
ncbi:hypothetical protein [Athalassotoga sp.]|uniref:hypothetical protein n=1 Tax=Athalassotoga sp. TaxID=2022597 RepID=UPI003CFD6020